jgi:hypothetical protein
MDPIQDFDGGLTMTTQHERQMHNATIPKRRCGNCLSRDRQAQGIDHCPACDPVEIEYAKIIIFVKGGMVTGVCATEPRLDIEICDWDNAECDEKAKETCEALYKAGRDMHAVY